MQASSFITTLLSSEKQWATTILRCLSIPASHLISTIPIVSAGYSVRRRLPAQVYPASGAAVSHPTASAVRVMRSGRLTNLAPGFIWGLGLMFSHLLLHLFRRASVPPSIGGPLSPAWDLAVGRALQAETPFSQDSSQLQPVDPSDHPCCSWDVSGFHTAPWV